MPQLHRWNVTAVVGVTLSSPVVSEEEFLLEEAMAKLRRALKDVRIDGKPLAIGHLTVKED